MNDKFVRLDENIEILNDLKDCEVLEVNECKAIYDDGDTYRNHIELVYQKYDDEIKHLCIFGIGEHNKFMECSFEKLFVYQGKLSLELCEDKKQFSVLNIKHKIVKSEDFISLKDIVKIEFYNQNDGYSNKDTLVIHSKSGNYFVDVALYDSLFVTKYTHKFLSSSGIKKHIKNHGYIIFSKEDDILSQLYPCSFKDDEGIVYNSSEQYMMAQKAKLFYDKSSYKKILKETNLLKIKKLGKKVNFVTQETWDEHKEQIVYYGNLLKFSQNNELKNALLATKNKMIIESNPNDLVWSCGLSNSDDKILEPSCWRGDNLLGEILMIVRDVLIEDDFRDLEDYVFTKRD
jgi:ribA/ribD-fused uncharacterized protein